MVVERTGLADDDAFDSVVLVDENGVQIGLSKTLNSIHQVTLNEPFTVKAGQTRTMTIGGNALASAPTTSNAGQIAYLALVSVSTSATISGTLPITGTGQTINENLTIGSLTTPTRGTLDPGSGNTKEVGTTGYYFSSVRFTGRLC